ncbi:hypothetical protein AAG906_001629 [Vitis piasezkii]
MKHENDFDCDSDSDDNEFTDEQRAEFFGNFFVEHERLIKSYMKIMKFLMLIKIRLKIRFLEFEHHSFLEKNNAHTQEIKNNKPSSSVNENFHPRTKVLNEILDKCKTHGDKRSLGPKLDSTELYIGGKRYALVVKDDFSRYSFESVGDNSKDLETTKDNPNDILERDIDTNNDEIISLKDTLEEIRDKHRSRIPKNQPISNVIACSLRIKLYQIDIKSIFLNEILSEEVYVEQPKGFEDPNFPNHIYRLKKVFYGLKQAPRAWSNDELLVAQIYVDDIVFGATSSELTHNFSKKMKIEFEMSMMGELTFFLGLQIMQLKDGIFLSQSKYAKEVVKKFGLESSKHFKTPMSTTTKLSKEASGKDVAQKLYRSKIGSLLYLTTSRLDISFSVGACAR